MCLSEPKTCPGLRGEAILNRLWKLQERNEVVNTFILLFVEYTRIVFVSGGF